MVETSRERIYFIYVDMSVMFLNKKIDAGNAAEADYFENSFAYFFYFFSHLIPDFRRYLAIGIIRTATAFFTAAGEIFIVEIEELCFIQRPFDVCTAKLVVSHYRKRELYEVCDTVFNKNFLIIVERDFYRIFQLFLIFYFRDADGRAQVNRLYE